MLTAGKCRADWKNAVVLSVTHRDCSVAMYQSERALLFFPSTKSSVRALQLRFLTQAHSLIPVTLNEVVQGLELGLSASQISTFLSTLC